MPVAPTKSQAKTLTLRRRAEQLAAPYPGLLAEAERVAAIVAQGVHGRRRAGAGESFWQYRNYTQSDSASQIDWRRSARSDHLYVRENEWEAANTVWFWRDGSAGMDWRSNKNLPTKKDRASVLMIALGTLLMRTGERCAVMGESEKPRTGRFGIERVSNRLATSPGKQSALSTDFSAHARLVLASDFLDTPDAWRTRIAALSARPASGVLLHIVDPAERSFPYRGRMRLFEPGAKTKLPFLLGRAEHAKTEYVEKFQAHEHALANTARRLGWTLITHTTDQPATHALTALYQALAKDT
ncbi:MAG: DUF58 domain-containing protein [Robiginitomaculum sp.]|nr:MAG: DUF58 domain-containing protein [Robiginitomaculum sp.]